MSAHTGSTEVAVTMRGKKADGTITSWEGKGWTTNCPHLVVTSKVVAQNRKSHVLTHAPSGCAILGESSDMPDLFRLADMLARFDWSSPDLYEVRPADWPVRRRIVDQWYLALRQDSSGAVEAVRA